MENCNRKGGQDSIIARWQDNKRGKGQDSKTAGLQHGRREGKQNSNLAKWHDGRTAR
jgi:hypothetical protein